MNNNFSFIDYFIFVSFLLCSAFIGILFGWRDRKKLSNDEFLTGGRNLNLFPVCMSLTASFISSVTILGDPAEVYLYGTQYAVNSLSFTIAVLIAANVFMPVYYKLNLTNVHKYLLRRFGLNAVRISGSIGFILCTVPYLGVVLYGPSLALASVTPISVNTSILVVGAICTFYTSIGGIKAVIWTDVIQAILMVLGVLIVAVLGSIELGGLIEPLKIAYDNNRLVLFNSKVNIYRGDTFLAVFLGCLMSWTGNYCVKQTQVQRYCCLGTPSKAKKALYWNIPGVLLIQILSIWCGIVIYAKYYNCDPISLKLIERHDQLMPYFVMETLSQYKGLPGLFVTCVFSGSLSTLSSGFNSLATVTWDDFFKRYFRNTKQKKQLLITKLIATTYGLLAISLAFIVGRLGTVLQATLALSGSITGPLLALFCLGLFCPCINAIGALCGLICGIGMCLIITVGTIIYPKPKGIQLPVSVNGCSREILDKVTNDVWMSANNRNYTVDYQPEGILRIYHISYLYIAVVGFVSTIIVGICLSLIVKRFCSHNPMIANAIDKSNDSLLSPIVTFLCPNCIKSKKENNERDENYFMEEAKVVTQSMVEIDGNTLNGTKNCFVESNPLLQ